jgi:hypothetical protein
MDDIGGKRMAVKVKWQPNWKSGSVMAIMVDDEAIDKVQSQFLPAEVCRFPLLLRKLLHVDLLTDAYIFYLLIS